MTDQHLFWAQIKRGNDVLLIPSTAWEEVLLPRIADYEAKWEELTGTWTVPAEAAKLIAAAVRELPSSELTRGVASRPVGEFWSDAVPVQALTGETAAHLREKAVAFLDAGEFQWKFVQI